MWNGNLRYFWGYSFSNFSIIFASFLGLDERDRARVYDEVVDFFNDVYFNGPVEKQNRLVSSQNEREPVYFYSNDFRSRDIFGNTLLNRYFTKSLSNKDKEKNTGKLRHYLL